MRAETCSSRTPSTDGSGAWTVRMGRSPPRRAWARRGSIPAITVRRQARGFGCRARWRWTARAGDGLPSFGGDNGAAAAAKLDTPTAVAIDAAGNLLIADSENHRVRKVSRGSITTVAGSGAAGFNGEVVSPAGGQLNFPRGV